ncbi:hypothetical protein [Sphingobium sp. B11D3D]|uniref:hypothetical protein n=1 Tax=Sphingobium sp. B11D3D TaxID=2940576 RepID=UPI0022246B44|nr:hypothetical protein [Sphingobium sp. B11D3D]MCW2368826.1 hypothetical protein [Sphingobium sp. B11D3D]
MTNSQYSMNYEGAAAQASAPQEVLPPLTPMPHYYMAPPKRGISAVLMAFVASVGTLGVVISLEMAAPTDWKPSSVFGSYNGRLAAEIKAHDLETQAEYQNWAQGVQLSVNQQVDAYRTKIQAVGGHYQAAMERAQMFAGSTARMQEAYLQQKMGQVIAQQGGDYTVINMARILGDLFSIGDEQTGRQIHAYADNISDRLNRELNQAVQSGVLIKVDGWDTNLPSPYEVQAELANVPPIQLPPLPRMSRDAKGE